MRLDISTELRAFLPRCIRGFVVLLLCTACSPNDLVNQAEVPSDVKDPNAIKSPVGAIEAYYGVLVQFADALASQSSSTIPFVYIYASGLLTDELRSEDISDAFPGTPDARIDSRNTINVTANTAGNAYKELQIVRGRAQIARQALLAYAPNSPPEFRGHLYAIEGFAEILLAELYCSGIPLSTLDLMNDYTFTRGFTTEQVFEHALQLLDSAKTYSGDSTRFQHFTDIARARVLLSLGKYEEAGQAVAGVPVEYQYSMSYSNDRRRVNGVLPADREGENGLPFPSDPRIQRLALGDSVASLTIASGIEALLIRAESDLQADRSGWLTTLNALRTTCTTIDDCPSPAPTGSGNVAGLPPLTDPDPDTLPSGKTLEDARIDLLFAERAYWLFLTGHRQGDLRRLVRVYGRPSDTVYPIGAWGVQQIAPYGSSVVLPVPEQEVQKNPLYDGCMSYEA